jgi:chromosome segregation protein
LEEREAVEARLLALQKQYYGSVWHDLHARMADVTRLCAADEAQLTGVRGGYEAMLADLHKLEVQETQSEVIIGLQREYELLSKKRGTLREDELRLKTALEVAHVRREVQVAWAPLPLTKIIEELEAVKSLQRDFSARLRSATTVEQVGKILDEFDSLGERTEQLVKRLQRPAPEAEKPQENQADPKVAAQLLDMQESVLIIDTQLKELSEKMHNESHREQQKKSEFFAVQRRLQDEQRKIHEIEQRLSTRKIDAAKFETRLEGIREEMQMEVPDLVAEILEARPESAPASVEQAQRELFSLKHQLELIGGIDPEVMKEFEETNARFTFLSEQLGDLSGALVNTEGAIKDFDEILKTRREEALTTLNVLFQEFFATLFKGGTAKLVPVYADPRDELKTPRDEETEEDVEEAAEERAEGVSREPVLVGIDIQAQPPGKRIKDISVLSGGERAMTSVALLCAIMASNPSPFVVLDEVDAALDEANSIRYADILEKLAEKTQFIVITHNRATMGKGDILYGVTMGEDGVSQLLSVKFADAQRWAK